MKTEVNKRNGISLIVLVITIIIMIILAGTIILSLSGSGIISNASKGAFQSDISAMQEELGVYIANKVAESKGEYAQDKLYADKESLHENGEIVEGKTIKDVLRSIDKKYLEKIQIVNGKVTYVGDNLDEIEWANEMLLGIRNNGVKANTSEEDSIVLEESANVNLINYRIYGNSVENESGEIQNVGDYVIDLEFDNKWQQGQIYGNEDYYTIRVISKNVIKSQAGVTYTISANLPEDMQIAVGNSNTSTYPFKSSNMDYDSGWNDNSITFTSGVDGYICISIRYDDDSNISPEDVEKYEIKVEQYTTEEEHPNEGEYKISFKLLGSNLLQYPITDKVSKITAVDVSMQKDYIEFNGNPNGAQIIYKAGESSAYFTLSPGTYYFKYEYLSGTMTMDESKSDGNVLWIGLYDDSSGWAVTKGVYSNEGYAFNYKLSQTKQFVLTEETTLGFRMVGRGVHENLRFRCQLTKEIEPTEYKPYEKPIVYNLYLDEPLRKVDNYVDYIDFRTQEIVRNIEEIDGELKGLSTPKREKISLPSILLSENISIIELRTLVSPSKIDTIYYTK